MKYECNKRNQEDVNVDIELSFPETDAQRKFSIMANSGTEMPDIIMGYDLIQAELRPSMGRRACSASLNEYYGDPEISYYFHHEDSGRGPGADAEGGYLRRRPISTCTWPLIILAGERDILRDTGLTPDLAG